MIQFPETAQVEWKIIADAANATMLVRKKIDRDARVETEVERLRVRHEASLQFQAELDADLTPALVMGSIADFVNMGQSTPVDLIEGVLKADGTCIMLGPGGAGKTTLSLQMLHSLLTGTDFLGRVVKKISGTVGILSYDQNAALMTNWIVASGLDPDQVFMIDAHGRGNPLKVPGSDRSSDEGQERGGAAGGLLLSLLRWGRPERHGCHNGLLPGHEAVRVERGGSEHVDRDRPLHQGGAAEAERVKRSRGRGRLHRGHHPD